MTPVITAIIAKRLPKASKHYSEKKALYKCYLQDVQLKKLRILRDAFKRTGPFYVRERIQQTKRDLIKANNETSESLLLPF